MSRKSKVPSYQYFMVVVPNNVQNYKRIHGGTELSNGIMFHGYSHCFYDNEEAKNALIDYTYEEYENANITAKYTVNGVKVLDLRKKVLTGYDASFKVLNKSEFIKLCGSVKKFHELVSL